MSTTIVAPREAAPPRIALLREQVTQRKGSWIHDASPFERDGALLTAGE